MWLILWQMIQPLTAWRSPNLNAKLPTIFYLSQSCGFVLTSLIILIGTLPINFPTSYQKEARDQK